MLAASKGARVPNETRAARQPQPQTTQAEAAARAAFAAESLEPQAWANPAGARYDWHKHPYHKVLFCLRGAITFHTPAGDRLLAPGDRLDLPPGTRHAATVGPTGVTCLEAARPAPRAKPRP